MPEKLSPKEKEELLKIARQSLEKTARKERLPILDLSALPPALQADAASFVTLTIGGELRGCIGTLEAYQPLALDVQERAKQAGSSDPRFSPVSPEELPLINIEISRLSKPELLEYGSPDELIGLLRPGIDGVVITEDNRRATFLPQVWDELPDVEHFLGQLCRKMGVPANHWKHRHLKVETYQVEEFSE